MPVSRFTELRRMVEEAYTPAPVESPLKDLGQVESFKAVDFYFSHSYEVYPPSAKPGEYQVAGPTAVFADKTDAALYVALRNATPALLAICEAAEAYILARNRLYNENTMNASIAADERLQALRAALEDFGRQGA